MEMDEVGVDGLVVEGTTETDGEADDRGGMLTVGVGLGLSDDNGVFSLICGGF